MLKSKFNKLYNIILLSIITLNKQYRDNLIKKCLYWSDNLKSWIIKYLDHLLNNKLANFLAKYFANYQLRKWKDPRIDKVKEALEFNPSIDPQKFKGTLDLFIQQYYTPNETKITLRKTKSAAKNIKYIDSIPQFSEKTLYEDGIVVYRVLDNELTQQAVRKIIDLHWGKDADPWCLAKGHGEELKRNYTQYWLKYTAYPKHIAFKNGKLLAFCANNDKDTIWWDRQDQASPWLMDGDKKIDTGNYLWTPELKRDLFFKKNNLKFNKKTQRWDSDQSVVVTNDDIVDGHFPIKFGIIKGNFECRGCTSLLTLEGGPTRVLDVYDCSNCGSLKTLEGAPDRASTFLCCNCWNLISLIGAPKELAVFMCNECEELTTLEGGPEWVGSRYSCRKCHSLKDLIGAPVRVNGDFDCSSCKNLLTLLGAPLYCEIFGCEDCNKLVDLVGAPEKVAYEFNCGWCYNLRSLKGAPQDILNDLVCVSCPKLTSLQGLGKVQGTIRAGNCKSLRISEEEYDRWNIRRS